MIKRRIVLLVACVLAFIMLCGFVDTTTELKANSAFSGSREMKLSFDIDTLDSLFAGGEDDLDRLIRYGIPTGMTYEKLGRDDENGTVDYLFTISFASLAEYQSRVQRITGYDVNVEFVYDNNNFSRSTRLVESFGTNDLFGWLQQAFDNLLGVGMTSETDLAALPDLTWNDRGGSVTINNDVYSLTGGNIIVEDGTGRMTQRIDISTVIDESFTFTRTVVIYFDPVIGSSAFASVCETVKSYLPEGSQFSFVDSTSERSCTAVFTASSAAQLAKNTSMIFGNTAASASVSPYEDSSLVLSTLTAFEESCSFTVLSNGEDIPFTYSVESYAGLPFSMYDIENGESIAVDTESYGNRVVYSGVGTDFSYRLVLESISTAQGIDYNLKVDSANSFTREIKIYMLEDTDVSILEQIADYYADKDAPRTKVKVVSESGQMPYICITIKGNSAQLCNAETILFGVSENRRLSYDRQGGLFRIHPDSTLVDSYDISSLLSLTNISTYSYTVHSGDTYLAYTVGEGDNGATYQLDKETSTIWQPTLLDGAMSFTFLGEYTNVVAIIFLCLLGVLLLLLAALALSIFLSRDEDEDEEAEEIPAQIPAGVEQPALPQPRDLASVFDEPEEEKPAALPVRIIETPTEEPAEEETPAESPADDILGIFTGISVKPDSKPEGPAPEPKPEPVPEVIPMPAPEPQPVPEVIPMPAPAPQPEPAPEPAPAEQEDPYADYVERFPMEGLPPITPSPIETVDEYSNRDFIEDLRYLGLLDDYKRRVSRVKVKVKKRPSGGDK